MAQTLTIRLSDAVYTHLQEIATTTQQTLEHLVQQSIEGNLPPGITNAPVEIQPELRAMQTLSVSELRQIANGQVSEVDQNRHAELLEKNASDTLSQKERNELTKLRITADRLMLRKAYAWALLRWHGQSIPALDAAP